tara:strand:+ start:144 stop:278 length:135 start_codon:yes stop_codon:yes gene_type:complete
MVNPDKRYEIKMSILSKPEKTDHDNILKPNPTKKRYPTNGNTKT